MYTNVQKMKSNMTLQILVLGYFRTSISKPGRTDYNFSRSSVRVTLKIQVPYERKFNFKNNLDSVLEQSSSGPILADTGKDFAKSGSGGVPKLYFSTTWRRSLLFQIIFCIRSSMARAELRFPKVNMADQRDLTTLNESEPFCKRCSENPATHRIRSEQVCQYVRPDVWIICADSS
jgi:hypothetical protein